jgi:pimeloyl-ACP methyl ester carboxylesterase
MTPARVAALREVGSREGSSYATREEFVARYRLRPASARTPLRVVRHLAEVSARQHPDGTWRHKFDRNVYAKTRKRGRPAVVDTDRHTCTPHQRRAQRSRNTGDPREVKARCPHVEFTEVADSDHHVTLDNPVGFVAAVRSFLSRHTHA